MTRPTALLTFSIGPVHSFIAQARRVADVWAGSDLLSHLMGAAIAALPEGGDTVFPTVDEATAAAGIPNRVVCRVPREEADATGRAMEAAVLDEWDRQVERAVEVLEDYGLEPADDLWTPKAPRGTRQTDHVFDIAWSWVPEEENGYADAARTGARRYAASRVFRPFAQAEERDEKCALCGVRTALPDGHRGHVSKAWTKAASETEETSDEPYFRYDQGRLCLVCATKRLYTRQGDKRTRFEALDRFHRDQAKEDRDRPPETPPYVALVACDGDRMGQVLAWGGKRISGEVESFHRALSDALSDFALSLRSDDPSRRTDLNLGTLGLISRAARAPQLIYAGGDDVLVVCAPEDALPVARALEKHYRASLQGLSTHLAPADLGRLTLSAAILYGHGRHPAGMLFRKAERLLHDKAKDEAGRDALAIRLEKRSGVPVEVAFKWSERATVEAAPTWPQALDDLVEQIRDRELSSTQTFNLRQEEKVLTQVLKPEHWVPWLADRLSRSERVTPGASDLAERVAPFFVHGKAEALRIARFLGREVER